MAKCHSVNPGLCSFAPNAAVLGPIPDLHSSHHLAGCLDLGEKIYLPKGEPVENTGHTQKRLSQHTLTGFVIIGVKILYDTSSLLEESLARLTLQFTGSPKASDKEFERRLKEVKREKIDWRAK
jgi:hypothetical protein